MQNLIKNREICQDDTWVLVRSAEEDFNAADDLIVPLELYLAGELPAGGRRAPWLSPDSDLEALRSSLASVELIAIDFPAFTDGRGYSLARLLRERYGYQGELRAIGDVQRDQLAYLAQVGFTAFAVRADRSAENALSGLFDFSEQYQVTALQPEPLFKRRAAN